MDKRNLTMLTDFYELTMGNAYLENGVGEQEVVFDLFYRKNPEGGGFAIACGLQSVIDYLCDLKFTEEDIDYLKSKGCFNEKFFDYLRNFKFSCDVWAMPEGTPVFPGEPIITVKGPAIQAQFIETMLLVIVNHQSLIATKANRIVRAAEGRPVMEFGSRRAHGADAAILGARSAYIAGCAGTACTISDEAFGIPALGTMAHSWVQLFDDEYEAFKNYARLYPDNCTLLVDTYDVLKSGVPNAIKVFDEFKPTKKGIRIDSGDVTYLTTRARKMLDDAGHPDCKIVISNSLDEYLIRDMLLQGACIDSFGVGERLITSKAEPVFGGVYKLVAVYDEEGNEHPRIKISENPEKVTNPGRKCIFRLFDKKGQAFADVIALADEPEPTSGDYTVVNPAAAKLKKHLDSEFTVQRLRVQVFDRGKLIYKSPSIEEIRAYCLDYINNRMWDEVKRFENPHGYYVDYSEKLYELKMRMLEEHDF
jgi:nicotinate phosphoribosyltransferase